MSDTPCPNRRRFLSSTSMALGALALPSLLWSEDTQAQQLRRFEAPNINGQTNQDFWSAPRVLNIKRYQNKEALHIAYYRNNALDIDGYNKICWLMRDLRANQYAQIDIRLLDLLCAMQAWVAYYGFTKPFQISSGYRTVASNSKLEGAARNSMHLKGKAVDLIIPELPVSYLGKLAQHYSAGGVGFYPDRGFVHVDTGSIRSWTTYRKRK